MGHSLLPPSKAGVWGKPGGCTGWVAMAKQYPEPYAPNIPAAEGTASHEVAEQRLGIALKGYISKPLAEGDTAGNGVTLTAEMIENAEFYANNFIETYSQCDAGTLYGIEDKLAIHEVHPECYGTLDGWIYDENRGELFVDDYKYGFVFVDVFENWQLICYTAGLKQKLQIPNDCNVIMRIIQPRAYSSEGPVREWRVEMGDLHTYFATLRNNAAAAMSGKGELITGSQCKHCGSRYACEPALRAGLRLYEVADSITTQELTPDAMGAQLAVINRALEQLGSLKSAYEEQIKATIKTGKCVSGWGLQQSYGRQKWKNPDEVLELGKLLELDLTKTTPITPKQAEALGVDKSIIAAYSETPQNGFKLVKDDGSKARRAFT
jgi:hypothetical protein